MEIPRFSAARSVDGLVDALNEAGCAVVADVMDGDVRHAIRAELAPAMDRAQVAEADDPGDFYPGRTRRVTALVTRSATVTEELIAHPMSTR